MIAFRFTALFLALLIDRVIGDPPSLWSRIGHPVVWFGRAIGFMERSLNRQGQSAGRARLSGVFAIAVLLCVAFSAGLLISSAFWGVGLAGLLAEAFFASTLIAQKSLADHVGAVSDSLENEGLDAGRSAVSMIVGRDPNVLDEAGVSRAAIESLAENFSDGVVAPVFWYLLGGLPGLAAYKMLNTADSMIGHKSEKYRYFGWASARLDDFANWFPARLSIFAIAFGALVSGRNAAAALKTALRDHGIHRSPNAGWPEGAMAGALNIRLAGPRIYAGETVDEPFINAPGRAEASRQDIAAGLSIFRASCGALAIVAGLVALITLM